MKAFRIYGSLAALTLLSVLAACGGGGGGGSTNPPPPPNNSPTPHVTTSPTTTPTSSASPTATATPVVTPTPFQCAAPSGSVAVDAGLCVSAEENFINGTQSWYTSGISTSWDSGPPPPGPPAGASGYDSASAFTGSPQDAMTCADTGEGTQFPGGFTDHAFVGIYNASGAEQALPQALGMVNPVPPVQSTPNPSGPAYPNNNFEVERYQCEYNVHTHDFSGLVHIEDTTLPANSSTPAYANLQTLLDEWQATISGSGLTAGSNTLAGAVTIYVGTPGAKYNGADVVNGYNVYSGAPSALSLAHHEAVWIVVGTTAGSIPPLPGQNSPGTTNGLPEVKFDLTH